MLILVVKELLWVNLLSDMQIMSNVVLIKLGNSLNFSVCRVRRARTVCGAREDIFRCMTVRSL